MEAFNLQPLFYQVCENLDDKQFALEGKSTTHALVYLLHVILRALAMMVTLLSEFSLLTRSKDLIS